MAFPPGHIPGYHFPGSLIPVGAFMAQQAAAAQQGAEMEYQRRKAFLLLLCSSSTTFHQTELPPSAEARA